MYVCICNGIRESCLRQAARARAGTAEALYQTLGYTPQCRQCLDDAEEIVLHERSRQLCAV